MRAYVSIRPTYNVAETVDYLELGLDEKKESHLAAGTNRIAAMYCDASSPRAFVLESERIASKYSRKVQAHKLIVSPPLNTYDKNKPEDMQRMVDDVLEGSRRLYRNSKLLLIAHNDSEGHDECGGKPHVHVVVMNHELDTGRAIKKNRTLATTRSEFNKLGAELGWAETEVRFEKSQSKVWRVKRAKDALHKAETDPYRRPDWTEPVERAKAALAEAEEFDEMMLTSVQDAFDATTDARSLVTWRRQFRAELEARHVVMETKHPKRAPHAKKSAPGVLFRARNSITGEMIHIKASDLSPDFTDAGQKRRVKVLQEQQRAAEVAAEQETPKTVHPEPIVVTDEMRRKWYDDEMRLATSKTLHEEGRALSRERAERFAKQLGILEEYERAFAPDPEPVESEESPVVEPEVVEVIPEPTEPVEPEVVEPEPVTRDEYRPLFTRKNGQDSLERRL